MVPPQTYSSPCSLVIKRQCTSTKQRLVHPFTSASPIVRSHRGCDLFGLGISGRKVCKCSNHYVIMSGPSVTHLPASHTPPHQSLQVSHVCGLSIKSYILVGTPIAMLGASPSRKGTEMDQGMPPSKFLLHDIPPTCSCRLWVNYYELLL